MFTQWLRLLPNFFLFLNFICLNFIRLYILSINIHFSSGAFTNLRTCGQITNENKHVSTATASTSRLNITFLISPIDKYNVCIQDHLIEPPNRKMEQTLYQSKELGNNLIISYFNMSQKIPKTMFLVIEIITFNSIRLVKSHELNLGQYQYIFTIFFVSK